MRPLVKLTSSRICDSLSHPAACRAGVMHFVQMSRSESRSQFTRFPVPGPVVDVQ